MLVSDVHDFKVQLHLHECVQTKVSITLLQGAHHLKVRDNKQPRNQTLRKIRDGEHITRTQKAWICVAHTHFTYSTKDEQRVRRQLLIIYWSIYSFGQDTFLCCPKVLHKEVIVRCPICFDQKTGKKEKKKKQYVIMKTDTHSKTARHNSEDTKCSLTVGLLVHLRPIGIANHP